MLIVLFVLNVYGQPRVFGAIFLVTIIEKKFNLRKAAVAFAILIIQIFSNFKLFVIKFGCG